jgi:hypothetical protein
MTAHTRHRTIAVLFVLALLVIAAVAAKVLH